MIYFNQNKHFFIDNKIFLVYFHANISCYILFKPT